MMQNFMEWLNWFVRWAHVIAGISWIGSSFYFMWLDSHLALPDTPKDDVEGELWMVHSGGFYQVEKRKITAEQMPKTLHWFKWEATWTWITGIFLLGLIYYYNSGVYLVGNPSGSWGGGTLTLISIGFLLLAWPCYDFLWQSALAQKGKIASAISFLAVGLAVYGLCQIMNGRAAYIHIGAMFGTLMVANVWVRILPAQRQMIQATQEGVKPDYSLGTRAKRRSVHNSYMTFPVLLIMLSNHYPGAYGHPLNWLILLLLIFIGAGIRHLMISKSDAAQRVFIPVSIAVLSLFLVSSSVPTGIPQGNTETAYAVVPFSTVKAIVSQRCVACHAHNPVDPTFGPMPGGVSFENPESLKALSERIKLRAVISKTMPLANKTGITDQERELLGKWVDQGAHID